jgi:hypothetical protein
MVGGLVFRKGQATNVTTCLKGARISRRSADACERIHGDMHGGLCMEAYAWRPMHGGLCMEARHSLQSRPSLIHSLRSHRSFPLAAVASLFIALSSMNALHRAGRSISFKYVSSRPRQRSPSPPPHHHPNAQPPTTQPSVPLSSMSRSLPHIIIVIAIVLIGIAIVITVAKKRTAYYFLIN